MINVEQLANEIENIINSCGIDSKQLDAGMFTKKLIERIENRKRLSKLEFILGQQLCWSEYAHDLLAIYNFKFNKEQMKIGGTLSSLMDCFNYGIMVGKRMERARRKGIKHNEK